MKPLMSVYIIMNTKKDCLGRTCNSQEELGGSQEKILSMQLKGFPKMCATPPALNFDKAANHPNRKKASFACPPDIFFLPACPAMPLLACHVCLFLYLHFHFSPSLLLHLIKISTFISFPPYHIKNYYISNKQAKSIIIKKAMTSFYELLDNPIDFNQIKPSVDTSNLGLLWNDINVLLCDESYNLSSSCFPAAAVAAPDSPIWSTSTSPTSSISSSSRQASLSPIEENTTFFDLLAAVEEERPHKCLYCTRAFSRRHDLERHVRVHTGVKPYHCPCCQKSFARSDARGRHFQSDPLCSQNDQVQKLIHKRKARTTAIKRY